VVRESQVRKKKGWKWVKKSAIRKID